MSDDDPHFVCSRGARTCADCMTGCTEDEPCPCCGGDDPDFGMDAEEIIQSERDDDLTVGEALEEALAEVERLTALVEHKRRIIRALTGWSE